MKIILLFLLLCTTMLSTPLYSADSNFKNFLNIQSKTAVLKVFSKKDIPFSDFGKVSEYQGVIAELDEQKNLISQADIYVFLKEDKISVSTDLCKKYAEKMFGADEVKTLGFVGNADIFESETGKYCALSLHDSTSKTDNYKFVILGFIHGRMTSLVWSEKYLNPEIIEIKKKFWKSLK